MVQDPWVHGLVLVGHCSQKEGVGLEDLKLGADLV